MRVVIALGGNALLRRGETMAAEVQRRNVLHAVSAAAVPIARDHEVIITHGNGPQIGLLALERSTETGKTVTLRHLMMLHRIDQGCARMNAGLAAVAIVLGFATGITATIRFVQSSAPAFASGLSFFLAAMAQPGTVAW